MPADPSSLTAASRTYLEQRDPADRRALGQYLTPRPLRDRLLDRLAIDPDARVLDPGVGTGEFLRSVRERCPTARLIGWDVDPAVLAVARRVVPDARLELRSALDPAPAHEVDVVVGNPPYFQLRLDASQRRRFAEVISGRANIFALFFHVGLDLLRPGGRLGFVVPPSMNSGAYFQALRDHICSRATVEHLEVHEDTALFEGARTAVQLIVLRKRAGSTDGASTSAHRRHVAGLGELAGGSVHRTLFCEDTTELRAAFAGGSTLWQLGYRAVTGTVVWNTNRPRLRLRPGPGTVPLLWASDIGDGRLRRTDDDGSRPRHIVGVEPLRGPAVVVNRVVGAVGSGRLRAAPVAVDEPFVAENHVNVVLRRDDVEAVVGWRELVDLLRSPAVDDHVARLTGNTQVSATELTHLLPLATSPATPHLARHGASGAGAVTPPE